MTGARAGARCHSVTWYCLNIAINKSCGGAAFNFQVLPCPIEQPHRREESATVAAHSELATTGKVVTEAGSSQVA